MMVEHRSFLTSADRNPPDARNVTALGVIEIVTLGRFDLEALKTSLLCRRSKGPLRT